ncbi:hypothetical protein H310_08806 [Aphanomyces invadans]|uniref:Methyltransferase small domain-containing protein n=1 Tax=Aphanomyces invadans TaxID=157072 RepID=A0A024TZD8_9STRA|nr:hypothetical protein H310_08806 [Aphanomyces invadans]ETV98727.1 hypothetical protein H310_08806 [Aphanomyces invadans]|eukprot:XP_008872924.1 hypothetical protein H310_08806 [Aphanomyces invadans]
MIHLAGFDDEADGGVLLLHATETPSLPLRRAFTDLQTWDRFLHKNHPLDHKRLPTRRFKTLMNTSWTRHDNSRHLHLQKNISLCEAWIQATFRRLPLQMQRDFIDPDAYLECRRAAADRVARTKAAKDLGQFFSPLSSINLLLDIVFAMPLTLSSALFLEPSCGTGNFFRPLVERGATRILGYEVDPLVAASASAAGIPEARVICGDFLTSTKPSDASDVIVVGNPPFSSAGDDVILSFLRHAVDAWQPIVVAFILPDRCAKPAYVATIATTLSRGGYAIHGPIVPVPDSHFDFHGRRINKPSVVLVCVETSFIARKTDT